MNAERLLSIAETAAYLRMSRSWLYQQVERKRIPHVRLGSVIRFDRNAIDRWLKKHLEAGPGTA